MSTHGFYILAAYGVSAVLLAAEVLLLWRRSRAQRHTPPWQEPRT